MTTYTLNGTPGIYNWGNASTWAGGVVPNGSNADVVLPTVTDTSTGQPAPSVVQVFPPPTYAIRSLTISNNTLEIVADNAGDRALAITDALAILGGGIVSLNPYSLIAVGSLSNQGTIKGSGTITSAGQIANSATIGNNRPYYVPGGTTPGAIKLTLTAASLTNSGVVTGALIDTPAAGFANLQGGTLSGGTYNDDGFDVGGLIVTAAANLTLTFNPDDPNDQTNGVYIYGATDQEYDPAAGTYVPIQSTLRTIAASGSLTTGYSYATSSLTVDGVLIANAGGTFRATHLIIDSGGAANINGTLTATITNDGVLSTAALYTYDPVAGYHALAAKLRIDGAVSGSGSLTISAAPTLDTRTASTLELNGPVSTGVMFADRFGALLLDQPSSFTGTIKSSGSGDTIDLAGIALSSVTNATYSGNTSGGILTLEESNGQAIALRLVGNYNRQSFALSAGPRPFSTSPPSLLVTVRGTPLTGSSFDVDGSQGTQVLVGTGTFNAIDTTAAAGSGSVSVDFVNGTVTKGNQLDAVFTNIQGVQLGADPSTILGLTSGTDVFHGGAGSDTFVGNGATDYITGGTGSNTVLGSTGDEIFYGGGGYDVMRGGGAANNMQGSSSTSGTDIFYGTTGNDYVYGHGSRVVLVAGTGNTFMSGGSGANELYGATHAGAQGHLGLTYLVGGSGTDLFVGGIGTNVFYEGSGTDFFRGTSGTDFIQGGAGQSAIAGGSGTEVITTGAGNQYVTAGTGRTYFSDTAAHLTAGRADRIDDFAGGIGTDLYLPTALQGATSFVAAFGGTAVHTAVGGGVATIFASNIDVATVQTHTHFTL